ncbi:MAG: AAA family ATPase [Candidatus Woesearchaeota archaeon]
MAKFVITGGPCTGKTTLLEKLQEAGYNTIPESARQIIMQEKEKAKNDPGYQPILPETNLAAFERLVVERQDYQEATASDEIQFLDRSLVDIVAYAERGNMSMDGINNKISAAGYTRVFLLDQLSDYKQDCARTETPEEAESIHKKICEVYDRLGCDIVRVPNFGPEKRLELVLREIEPKRGEIEGKYPVRDLDTVKERISRYNTHYLGASNEKNTMHDIYRMLDCLGYSLRLRENGRYLVTLKGNNNGMAVNERKEAELEIPKPIYHMLKTLLPMSGSYDKVRESYMPVGDASCTICLDYLPKKGSFVEIEAGTENQVLLWKNRLGIAGACVKQPYHKIGEIHAN